MKETAEKNLILGIDTSNYKTSVAVIDRSGTILSDFRKILKVKQGERGLRQSDALFQHIEELPYLLKQALPEKAGRLCAVAVSSRPRPQEGSYMPVFKAGVSTAYSIGAACGIPVYEFSHQEGHLSAAAYSADFTVNKEFLAYHLSGGTCELLRVSSFSKTGYNIEILGGTKDISFGQVIDRAGVLLGFDFPAGEAMDHLAQKALSETKLLKKIPLSGLFINLSGIDTQCRRALSAPEQRGLEDAVIKELFTRIAEVLLILTEKAVKETKIKQVLFFGGVASSAYIRNYIKEALQKKEIKAAFGSPALSQDNAVGTALLGMRTLWQ